MSKTSVCRHQHSDRRSQVGYFGPHMAARPPLVDATTQTLRGSPLQGPIAKRGRRDVHQTLHAPPRLRRPWALSVTSPKVRPITRGLLFIYSASTLQRVADDDGDLGNRPLWRHSNSDRGTYLRATGRRVAKRLEGLKHKHPQFATGSV